MDAKQKARYDVMVGLIRGPCVAPGMRFVVVDGNTEAPTGSIVELARDDLSPCPSFLIDGRYESCLFLWRLEPVGVAYNLDLLLLV